MSIRNERRERKETAEMIAAALEDMDLSTMTQLLDNARDKVRGDIEKVRSQILQLERWGRPWLVLSDLSRPEQTREEQMDRLTRWHESLQKQLRFVLKFGSVVRDMESKAAAPGLVAAVLATRAKSESA